MHLARVDLQAALQVPLAARLSIARRGIRCLFLKVRDLGREFRDGGSPAAEVLLRQIGVEPLGAEFVRIYKEQGGTGSNSAGHRKLGLTEPRYHVPFKRILIRRKDAI